MNKGWISEWGHAAAFLIMLWFAGSSHAVEDCFDDFCDGSEPILSGGFGFFVTPSGTSSTPEIFRGTGAIEYDTTAGNEMFALAGEAYIDSGAAPGTQIDRARVRMQVHNIDTQSRLRVFNAFINSDEYTPLAPGFPGHLLAVSGGIVNGSAGRHVAFVFVWQPVDQNQTGAVEVQVYTTAGVRLWRTRFRQVLGNWELLTLKDDFVSEVGVVIGDIISNDGIDELRVVYHRETPDGRQFYEHRYYNVSTGAELRRDVVTVIAP